MGRSRGERWEDWIEGQNTLAAGRKRIEYEKCRRSVGYFVHEYCWAKDERTGRVWRFRLWPFQRWLLGVLLETVLLCLLKGRQLGVSWLVVAYGVWLFTFYADRYVLLFSQREEEAKELLKRAKFIRWHLPSWLQVTLAVDNVLEIESVRGSRIQAFPARGSEGRSYAASLAVIDEAGTVPKVLDLITALEPVVEGGGKLVVLGTARGVGEFFTLIRRIRAGLLEAWRFAFLPWWSRPDRDEAWYEAQKGKHLQKWRLRQEHPSTVDEAFQLGHPTRFDSEMVMGLLRRVRRPLPAGMLGAWAELPDELREVVRGGQLRVWFRPKGKRKYLIGADTAEGVQEGDRCAAVVADRETGLAVAELAGWWADHYYAHLLAELGRWYNGALLGVERNNTGHSVLNSLVNVERYAPLYGMRTYEQDRGKRYRPGWQTSTKTKPIMYDVMEQALADGERRWYSEEMLGEALICARHEDGTVGAPEYEGAYDDVVVGYCIAEAIRQGQPGTRRRSRAGGDVWGVV